MSISLTVLIDVQFRKESQSTFHILDTEVFIWQRSHSLRSCVKLASLISLQPATRRVSTDLSLCLDTLFEPRDVVSNTLAPRFLWSFFEAKNISKLSPFFCGRCCPSYVSSLAIKGSIPRRFMSAAPGQPSPDQLVALLPTSRAATDQLNLRFSPVLYRRTSCWLCLQPLGLPSQCGRYIRSVLCSIDSCVINMLWRYFRVLRICLVKEPAEHTGESVLVVSELLCTGVQRNAQEHKQRNAREMCSFWERSTLIARCCRSPWGCLVRKERETRR